MKSLWIKDMNGNWISVSYITAIGAGEVAGDPGNMVYLTARMDSVSIALHKFGGFEVTKAAREKLMRGIADRTGGLYEVDWEEFEKDWLKDNAELVLAYTEKVGA